MKCSRDRTQTGWGEKSDRGENKQVEKTATLNLISLDLELKAKNAEGQEAKRE